ncbi:MAG: multidrug efflux SMR transporter [Desulfobacter sp.]
MGYVYLAAAIVLEVIATSALKATKGFTVPFPSLIVIVGYGLAFYFLSLVLETMNMGVAYAIWAGLGVVLVALAGSFLYRQVPDLPAIIGMGLIVAGVVVINLFSRTTTH